MPSRLPLLFLAALTCIAAGCASDESKRRAMIDVNEEFRIQYERILAEKGTRIYLVRPEQAFKGVVGALGRLGFHGGNQVPGMGYLNVVAPAPIPLNAKEWQQVNENDLPRLREIIFRHIGPLAQFVSFEPEGLNVVITATTLEVTGGTEISFTARMREVAPPRSGMPRREYLPPTAVRMGLDKIWAAFESELKGPRRRF